MKHAAVRTMPKERWREFPRFSVLAEWADDRTVGDDGPTMKVWEVWFQGIRGNRPAKWFIWHIPGWRDDWNDFRQRLAERAGLIGLTTVYIYNDPRPMDKAMYDLVVDDNKKREAEIIEFRKQEQEWEAKNAAA